jgi:anthranilate phosphoribosyltransferase
VVLFNAAAALFISGVVSSIEEGIRRAAEAIDAGRSQATLDALIALSNSEPAAAGAGA